MDKGNSCNRILELLCLKVERALSRFRNKELEAILSFYFNPFRQEEKPFSICKIRIKDSHYEERRESCSLNYLVPLYGHKVRGKRVIVLVSSLKQVKSEASGLLTHLLKF